MRTRKSNPIAIVKSRHCIETARLVNCQFGEIHKKKMRQSDIESSTDSDTRELARVSRHCPKIIFAVHLQLFRLKSALGMYGKHFLVATVI